MVISFNQNQQTISSMPEPEEVSSGIRRWLAEKFSGEVTDAEAPVEIGSGSDFWVYGLRFAGPGLPARWTAPLVARVPAVHERFDLLERQSRMQAWVAEQGYPAPLVLGVVPPGTAFEFPVQVMERTSGTTMMELMGSERRRIPALLREFAAQHVALHNVPVPDWAISSDDWAFADDRLFLTRYLVENGASPGLKDALERIERILPLFEVPSPVICHGDFNPGNLLIDAGKVSVIDWTTAGIGDRHGDIAWTEWVFYFAAAIAPTRPRRLFLRVLAPVLSRVYMNAYRRDQPVDAARLRLWRSLNSLVLWTVAVADESGHFGPSRVFHDGLPEWAEKQFRRHVKKLP